MEKVDQSIHPRVVNGVTAYAKVNTSKPKNKDTIKRSIAGIERHLENFPGDGMSQKYLSKLKSQL